MPPSPAANADHKDLVIEIPATLPYGATAGPWTSRHAIAKLRLKYETVFHSREFDSYAAARAAADPSWRDRLEMADLLATWLMQSQIERRPGAIEAVLEKRREIEAALTGVPADLALEQAVPDQAWEGMRSLLQAFRVKGVAIATMTKVLCMKRPALIPMLDSHVMGFLFNNGWPPPDGPDVRSEVNAAVVAIKQFRELMLHGENLAALMAIRAELAPWLATLDVSSRVAPSLSLVRILDNVLWYDWKGHNYFGSLEEGLPIRALIVRLKDADHSVRWRAVKALGEAGPAARQAVEALTAVRHDESEDSLVRSWAERALNQICRDVA